MPYLPTALLTSLGVVLLAVLLIRTLMVMRKFNRARTTVQTEIADGTGLLKARSAALLVAIRDRCNPRVGSDTNPRSINAQGRQEDHRG